MLLYTYNQCLQKCTKGVNIALIINRSNNSIFSSSEGKYVNILVGIVEFYKYPYLTILSILKKNTVKIVHFRKTVERIILSWAVGYVNLDFFYAWQDSRNYHIAYMYALPCKLYIQILWLPNNLNT